MRGNTQSLRPEIGRREICRAGAMAASPDRLGRVPVVRMRRPAARSAGRTPPSVMLLRAALCAAAVLILIFVLTVEADAGEPGPPDIVHVVGEGDSLWSIAEGFSSQGTDVRRLVADIRETNGLSSSLLQVGQRIIIPAALAG